MNVYLDNNATTFLDPEVRKVMIELMNKDLANSSSVHAYGQKAKSILSTARKDIASFFKVKPHEVIFTSGGTEALNMTIRGIFGLEDRGHIITSDVEHPAVFNTVKQLEKKGAEATFLRVGSWGAVTEDAVRAAIRADTKLIVLMAVNNETGIKTDIEAIARMAYEAKIPFIVDGVALLGKESFTIPEGVTAFCFGAHKCHGPKGTGMAILRSTQKLDPMVTGGSQEYFRRAGTENLVGIAGLAKAVTSLRDKFPEVSLRMQSLRDRFENGLKENLADISINGEGPRVVNTSNISFHGIEGESLLMNLDLEGVAASHGSACSSGSLEPSRILLNMGISRAVAASSVRFSFSRMTTEEEIDYAVEKIVSIVTRLRELVTEKK